MAGTVGALFSSTIAVREKSSSANLNKLENIVDGVSRVLIGAISAGVLILFLKSGYAPDIKVGNLVLDETSVSDDIKLLAIGFVASFLERLVPDFLAKKK